MAISSLLTMYVFVEWHTPKYTGWLIRNKTEIAILESGIKQYKDAKWHCEQSKHTEAPAYVLEACPHTRVLNVDERC